MKKVSTKLFFEKLWILRLLFRRSCALFTQRKFIENPLTEYEQTVNTLINNPAREALEELLERYPALKKASEELEKCYFLLCECFRKDGILYLCGNGGSAADAEHIAGELMKGFLSLRPLPEEMREKIGDEAIFSSLQQGLRAVSLLSHPALSSAFANDVDPRLVYAQQLYVMGREGDVLLGITTSGNAKNVLAAFKVAKAKGMKTILLTGENHGLCEAFADLAVHAPEKTTYKVQEYHLPLYHTLCIMLERTFYGK